jgi:hypothetical protein
MLIVDIMLMTSGIKLVKLVKKVLHIGTEMCSLQIFVDIAFISLYS